MIAVYMLCFMLFTYIDAKSQVQSSVKGDETVGGVHLFEIHSQSGGIGMGIKILVVGLIVLAVMWWCCRKMNNCTNLYLDPARDVALAAVARNQPERRVARYIAKKECHHCKRGFNRLRRTRSEDSINSCHLSPA